MPDRCPIHTDARPIDCRTCTTHRVAGLEAIAAEWQASGPLVDARPAGEPRNPLTVPKATAPDCPTCAGAGMWLDDDDGLARPCPECRPGAVPVPRLAVVQ